MTIPVEVAISRGPARTLTYSAGKYSLVIGNRVLVPLGGSGRRLTGYVVGVGGPLPEYRLKPIAALLDPEPVFDAELCDLFRFIARYYHASLGDVIRTGLPAGLDVADSRTVRLTEAGRARALLDPIMTPLLDGPKPLKAVKSSLNELLKLAQDGLVELVYELDRARTNSKMIRVVHATGEEPTTPLRADAGPDALLQLLRSEGEQDVPSLKERIPNHNSAVRRLVEVGAAAIKEVRVHRDPWRGAAEVDVRPTLTTLQKSTVDRINEVIDAGSYQGFLLRGVTGSGKTEVYLHAIEHALSVDRGGIVLVPEIALTPQLAGRFRARFGDEVAVLHSGLSDGERLDQWDLIRKGKRRVVVGARSALFAPVKNLGVIVVDEEHESSFKQDETPRYHARDMALKRGHRVGCPVVLGSATPSLETVHNAESGRIERLDLPDRIADRPLPEVEMVDLRIDKPVRSDVLLSRKLITAIRETVDRGEQVIIFLNRRGFSNCLLCKSCGESPTCDNCSITLTYHRNRRRLICHYCGFQSGIPTECPECRAESLQMVGAGTEQVEAVIAEEVPGARVARMDRDTTRGRALTSLLDRYRAREIDVMVGTQMIAKGHDFPQVTLVGVLLAEQMLKMQDFRAAERTFQLLTQVSGRAGRHHLPGRVLIQTFDPSHYSLQCARHHDFQKFVDQERRYRRLRSFPPFGYVVLIRLDAPELATARDAAGRVARAIAERIEKGGLQVNLVGPNPAAIERIKNRTRFQIMLTAGRRADLHQVITGLADDRDLTAGARIAIDVDPVNLM
ncbi:MAG: primosomal protein N' (replication factor Y) [Myxococcota bacterium]